MDLLLNDLSFHGQFPDVTSFRGAIDRLMAIRQVTPRFGRTLYCHRRTAHAQITPDAAMQQAVRALTPDTRRALLRWLNQQGPYWEDERVHNPDDWLECNGEIVTDTAVGEAGWCCLHGVARALVSAVPSDWMFSPVGVEWVRDDASRQHTDVFNYWEAGAVEAALEASPVPIATWEELDEVARTRFTELSITTDAFSPLAGYPFVPSAAERVVGLLHILHRLRQCVDEHGERTTEGHRLYQDHFTGENARFSDSSDAEKREFAAELTFQPPTPGNQPLFCPWHGKVRTPQLRIHFTWPVPRHEPLHVVYVGPKITRR